MVNEQTGSTVLPATWVKKVGNAKIGFIGMTLEGTDSLVAPSGVAGWDFQDEVEAGNRAAASCSNEQGVKAIVVLLHEGGVQTGTYNGCVGISGPIVEIAERLDPSIDALITGTRTSRTTARSTTRRPAAQGRQRVLVRPDHHRDELRHRPPEQGRVPRLGHRGRTTS